VQIDRETRSDEVPWALVHEVIEAEIADDAAFRRVTIFRDPDRAAAAFVRLESAFARCNGRWLKIATAFASRHRQIVDLDDSRQVVANGVSTAIVH